MKIIKILFHQSGMPLVVDWKKSDFIYLMICSLFLTNRLLFNWFLVSLQQQCFAADSKTFRFTVHCNALDGANELPWPTFLAKAKMSTSIITVSFFN